MFSTYQFFYVSHNFFINFIAIINWIFFWYVLSYSFSIKKSNQFQPFFFQSTSRFLLMEISLVNIIAVTWLLSFLITSTSHLLVTHDGNCRTILHYFISKLPHPFIQLNPADFLFEMSSLLVSVIPFLSIQITTTFVQTHGSLLDRLASLSLFSCILRPIFIPFSELSL